MVDFIQYRLPNKNQYVVLEINADTEELFSPKELSGKHGFVFAPFSPSEKEPIYLFHPNRITVCEIKDPDKVTHSSNYINSLCEDRDLYSKSFNLFHKNLIEGKFQKIVLARKQELNVTNVNPTELFIDACKMYPNMFIALVKSEKAGTWLTATPEILLSGDKNEWHTMALAGTMKSSGKNKNPFDLTEWSKKNVEEQKIVADYIFTQIEKLANIQAVKGPYTSYASDLLHLRTDFSFIPKDVEKIGELIDMLFPTPAVCGLPKEKAREFIIENEGINRRFYSGFIGPLNMNDSTSIYVTLRCMSIMDNNCSLYAGGGLLVQSKEENEWNETAAKMDTMKKLLCF